MLFSQFLGLHVFWEFNWCLLLLFALTDCLCMWDAFECVCVRRWCSSQLEKESGKGAISAQLTLIASTLFWWAAALCEMTKCCVPGLPLWPLHRCRCSRVGSRSHREREQAARPWIYLPLSLRLSSAHSVDLFLTPSLCLCCCSCSIFAWSNIAASLFRSQCVYFFT